MNTFYWIEPERVAGCSQPGADDSRLSEDLDWLYDHGIRAILSLTEETLIPSPPSESRFRVAHLPIPDMTAPTLEQLAAAIQFIESQVESDNPVVVHCRAGLGRTGTVLAAWLVSRSFDGNAAIAAVRSACPGAIETPSQEAAILELARNRDDPTN